MGNEMTDGYDARSLGLRVSSCRTVIQDVGRMLAREEVNPRIVDQLNKLLDLLKLIDCKAVTESDLDRIEGCTNQLMDELGILFSHQGFGQVYDQRAH